VSRKDSSTFRIDTISDELTELKEKIKIYEDDLQAAKKAGDKEEVKQLREEVKQLRDLLIELQKKENNLLIAKDKIEGTRTSSFTHAMMFHT
jgi:uncharacterized membrane protein (DUF106 family)